MNHLVIGLPPATGAQDWSSWISQPGALEAECTARGRRRGRSTGKRNFDDGGIRFAECEDAGARGKRGNFGAS